jgi:HK97 family phage major capsid protein
MTHYVRALRKGSTADYSRPEGDQVLAYQRGDLVPADHWAVADASPGVFGPADASRQENTTMNRTPQELRQRVASLTAEMGELHARIGDAEATSSQAEHWHRLVRDRDRAQADYEAATAGERSRLFALGRDARTENGDGATGAPEFMRRVQIDQPMDVLRTAPDESRSQALKLVETRSRELTSVQLDQLDGLIRKDTADCDGSYIARRTLITESPAYRSAWHQLMVDPHPLLTGDEATAVRAFRELERLEARAMNEGTGSAGGYGVPAMIDPTIVLSSGAADAPILQACRIEQMTSRTWTGVTSAGVAWSYDAEEAEVSDDSPTLAQPGVTAFMARGFIPYSIELGMDYPTFAQQMSTLMGQGYVDLLAVTLITGGGTTTPRGILTALDANTNDEVVTTTDGSFGAVDIFKVWNALPERARTRATWLMSVTVESAIRAFSVTASGNPNAYFTVDLTEGGITALNGRPVIRTDYMPSGTNGSVPGTTGAANILIVGNFHSYLFGQRAGMSVEPVSHLFGNSNRPTGQRGWFAWARNGGNSLVDVDFRLLQNQ